MSVDWKMKAQKYQKEQVICQLTSIFTGAVTAGAVTLDQPWVAAVAGGLTVLIGMKAICRHNDVNTCGIMQSLEND